MTLRFPRGEKPVFLSAHLRCGINHAIAHRYALCKEGICLKEVQKGNRLLAELGFGEPFCFTIRKLTQSVHHGFVTYPLLQSC